MSESERPSTREPSLNPLRIAAAVGVVIAALIVVLAFSVSVMLGLLAVLVSPVLPLAVVLAVDRFRRY